jgi:uncharacterized protein YbcI
MEKTKGEREAEFTKAIVKLEKDYLGRGPLDARTFFIKDMVLVRLRGVLTPAEEKLAGTPEGRVLVRDARRQLFETSRSQIEEMVDKILDASVVDLFSDISTETGERIIVLTVAQDLVSS